MEHWPTYSTWTIYSPDQHCQPKGSRLTFTLFGPPKLPLWQRYTVILLKFCLIQWYSRTPIHLKPIHPSAFMRATWQLHLLCHQCSSSKGHACNSNASYSSRYRWIMCAPMLCYAPCCACHDMYSQAFWLTRRQIRGMGKWIFIVLFLPLGDHRFLWNYASMQAHTCNMYGRTPGREG